VKALIRTQRKFRPVSGELLGYRIQATVPNAAGRRMIPTEEGDFRPIGGPVPAFRKPYLILETGDLPAAPTEAELAAFKHKLEWEGFSEFEMVGKKADEQPKLSAAGRAAIARLTGKEPL
jgi:hypothetical protein